MESLSLKYVSSLIDNSSDIQSGRTATVSTVIIDGRKYAFKKYRPDVIENLSAMEKHISGLFDYLVGTKYSEIKLFGAFPQFLVRDEHNNFCGFLMDMIPRECYVENQIDRHLGAFYGIEGEVNQFSDSQIGQFVKNLAKLIFDLHKSGYILGDVLNDQNLYVRATKGELYPYLVDIDSLRKDQENPAKTYHSPNFEPPEGEDSPSSKASDVYKYCLIVLRIFSRPEKEYERAGLRIEDVAAKESLHRIGSALGESYKNIIIKGLANNPLQRPQISEVLQSFSIKRNPKTIGPNELCPCGSGLKYKHCHGKNVEISAAEKTGKSEISAAEKHETSVTEKSVEPEISTADRLSEMSDTLVNKMISDEDYIIKEPLSENNILITLNGIKKIESFFMLNDFNDSANRKIEKSIYKSIYKKEIKRIKSQENDPKRVQKLIDSLGEVKYNEESRKKISEARLAYSNLSVPLRILVQTDKLNEAEKKYEKLGKQNNEGKKKKRNIVIAASLISILTVMGLIIGNHLPASSNNDTSYTVNDEYSGDADNNGYGMIVVQKNDTASSTENSSDKTEEQYLVNSIDELNNGMAQGIYKQIIFSKSAIYCLNNDGTINVYPVNKDSDSNKISEYATWNSIDSIVLASRSTEESIIGLKNDGTVIAPSDATVFHGNIDVSQWNSIVQLNRLNDSIVMGLTSDGTVMYTPSTRKFDGEPIFTQDIASLNGCKKVLSIETKDIDILGLTSYGTVVPVSSEHPPYLYYHDDWGAPYLSWSNVKDIDVCSQSTDLVGLTENGNILYGGEFGHGAVEYFDEESLNTWKDVTAISAGSKHLVALRSDGTVLAAGSNEDGQCNVSDWKDIIRVEAYGDTTVAYDSNGKIYYTGYNCLEKALANLQD